MAVEVETEAIKRKKGLKQIDYKCEVIKRAKVKGLEYRNWKGNVVQKKELNGQCRVEAINKSKEKHNTFKYSLSSSMSGRIESSKNLLAQGKAPLDKRGKPVLGNAKSGDIVLQVSSHIASFP
ncbi:hypothetical protein J6590_049330 [Homalodisca vitripennis]|nr:hypothetical protein J6590_049330 [Homalodisca vitripennis]